MIRVIFGDPKASGYMLAEAGTAIVGVGDKRSAPAGNINHLSLCKCLFRILGKPDWQRVTQSLFCSSLVSLFHYLCKSTDLEADFMKNRGCWTKGEFSQTTVNFLTTTAPKLSRKSVDGSVK